MESRQWQFRDPFKLKLKTIKYVNHYYWQLILSFYFILYSLYVSTSTLFFLSSCFYLCHSQNLGLVHGDLKQHTHTDTHGQQKDANKSDSFCCQILKRNHVGPFQLSPNVSIQCGMCVYVTFRGVKSEKCQAVAC